MYSPITRSCIGTILEKQIVLRCNLLILVLKLKCFLSIILVRIPWWIENPRGRTAFASYIY